MTRTLEANCTIMCGITIGPYALKLSGWICRFGVKLLPKVGKLECSGSGKRYRKRSEGVEESVEGKL